MHFILNQFFRFRVRLYADCKTNNLRTHIDVLKEW